MTGTRASWLQPSLNKVTTLVLNLFITWSSMPGALFIFQSSQCLWQTINLSLTLNLTLFIITSNVFYVLAIGDSNGHIGLGVKCSKEVATAIRGAIILAKLSVVPVRRGYWGNKIGKPHTVPCKVCNCSILYLILLNLLIYRRTVDILA